MTERERAPRTTRAQTHLPVERDAREKPGYGCVERDLLRSIAELRWDRPAPRLDPGEARRARRGRRLTRWVLRAEPLFDVLLPSRW